MALKRRARLLEQELSRLSKVAAKAEPVQVTDEAAKALRFNAKGHASQRHRLGLSVIDCGLLLGTSAQSIYNWESGKVRPLARYLPEIVALRTMGKREVAARLGSLREAA